MSILKIGVPVALLRWIAGAPCSRWCVVRKPALPMPLLRALSAR